MADLDCPEVREQNESLRAEVERLKAACELAIRETRGVIGLDATHQARLTAARDALLVAIADVKGGAS